MSRMPRNKAHQIPADWDPDLRAKIMSMMSDRSAASLSFPARPSARCKTPAMVCDAIPSPHDLRLRSGLRVVRKTRRVPAALVTYATTVLAALLIGSIIGAVASHDMRVALPHQIAAASQAAAAFVQSPQDAAAFAQTTSSAGADLVP